jgi:benzoate-CoA ligase
MKINFANWILERYGSLNKNACVDKDQSITYQQLSCRVKTLSHAIQTNGILPGDVVIICMEDCVDWPCAWLACLHSGAVPMPASTVIGFDLLDDISKFVNCKLFIAGDAIASQIKCVEKQKIWDRKKLQTLWQQPCDIEAVMVEPDTIGYMAMSSGSTGIPKVACFHHQVFFDIVKYIPEKLYGMNQDSVMLSIPKMSWGYGLQSSITYTLGVGATAVVMAEPPAPSTIFDYMEKFQPTIVASSPMIIRKLVKNAYKNRQIPNSVKIFSSAGEDLPEPLYDEFFSRFGLHINTAIGSLEVANICYAATCGNPTKNTVGKVLPGCKIQIQNSQGNECQPNEIGEIYVATSMMACCYLNSPEKTAETFVNGWVKTGDLGFINNEQNLVFVGRIDDVFKINDLIISPVEIESKILKYPGVDRTVVAGVESGHNKELHAWIVNDTVQFDRENFVTWLKSNLAPHQVPKKIHYVEVIDETITNKQDRKSLVNKLTALC